MHLLALEKTAHLLQQILSSSVIPQVLLIFGREGFGQMEFAKSFASACSQGKSFLDFEAPSHPDVKILQLDEKGYHSMQAIKDLTCDAHIPPYQGKKKVFIIDEADKMQISTANALLKTLEEPALSTHFILITSSPSKMIGTIVSRCIKVLCTPLKKETLQRYLVETENIDQEKAESLALLAEGSLTLLKELLQTQDAIWKEAVFEVITCFHQMAKETLFEKLDLIDKSLDDQHHRAQECLFDLILKIFRDISILKIGSSKNLIFEKERDRLYKASLHINKDFDFLEKVWRDSYEGALSHVKLKTCLEVLLFRVYQE
jgi:DNA polymerase III subunit delta'